MQVQRLSHWIIHSIVLSTGVGPELVGEDPLNRNAYHCDDIVSTSIERIERGSLQPGRE